MRTVLYTLLIYPMLAFESHLFWHSVLWIQFKTTKKMPLCSPPCLVPVLAFGRSCWDGVNMLTGFMTITGGENLLRVGRSNRRQNKSFLKAWNLHTFTFSSRTSGLWLPETGSWVRWTVGLISFGILVSPHTVKLQQSTTIWGVWEEYDSARIGCLWKVQPKILLIISCIAFATLFL